MRGRYQQMQGRKLCCWLRLFLAEDSLLLALICCANAKVYR
ncbi:hypothetical protein [Snodgrassella gandavensis]|nr:hypothetical protein [Snodgrassella gandavensis]